MSWIVIHNQYYKFIGALKYPTLPISTDGCLDFNSTYMESSHSNHHEEPFFLYRITHYYYTLIGFSLVFLIGTTTSWLFKGDEPPVHPDLISPIAHRFLTDESKKLQYFEVDVALKQITNESMQIKENEINCNN